MQKIVIVEKFIFANETKWIAYDTRLYHAGFLPFPAAPTDVVDDGTVKFVGGHAEPDSHEPEIQYEGEQQRCAQAAGPHHGRPHDGGKLGIARGAECRRDDHVCRLEGLEGHVAPEAEPAQPDDFWVGGIEAEQMLSE